MVKRKNQVLIDSDSSDSEGSGSDLESVSILLNNLFYFINLSRIKKSAFIYGLLYLNLDLYFTVFAASPWSLTTQPCAVIQHRPRMNTPVLHKEMKSAFIDEVRLGL